VLSAALYTRFRSQQEHTFVEKMLSAMRQKFGTGTSNKSQAKATWRSGRGEQWLKLQLSL
jgi:hypothetical protein